MKSKTRLKKIKRKLKNEFYTLDKRTQELIKRSNFIHNKGLGKKGS